MKPKSSKVRPEPHLVDHESILRPGAETEIENTVDGESARPHVPESFSWGEAPTDSGGPVPALAAEDEALDGEKMLRGGAEAAESSRRKAAEIGRQDRTRL